MKRHPVAAGDDAMLISAICGRSEGAFEALYRHHAGPVHAVVSRMVRDQTMADDVTQHAFLKLWERAATIRPENLRLRAWLIAVAHHAALDAIRRRRPTASLDEVESVHAFETTDHPALEAEQRRSIRAALDGLPADQRRVVELAYFGGLTQTEIADMLEQPLGTIKGRIRLAMRKLRDVLGSTEEEYA